MIKAVLFDCYGVLISEIYGELQEAYPKLDSIIEEVTTLGDLGEIDGSEVRKRTVEILDGAGENGGETMERAFGVARKNVALLGMIEGLRGQYKTGVISNASTQFWELFEDGELNKYFDDVVVSCEVGMMKPDARIFELAAERLGVLPEECVFVDDRARNVEAAEACGMKGVLYEWGMYLKI